jgi:hypothetical protein
MKDSNFVKVLLVTSVLVVLLLLYGFLLLSVLKPSVVLLLAMISTLMTVLFIYRKNALNDKK